MALDARGKIVAAGYTSPASGVGPVVAVARYLNG
jgi:hypothetical protein